jgi:hypothetical protein
MAKALVEIPLVGGGIQRITSLEQAREWITNVRAGWGWMSNVNLNWTQVGAQGHNALRQVIAQVEGITATGNERWPEAVKAHILQTFRLGSPLDPDNPIVQGIRQTYASLGIETEANAVAMFLGAESRAGTNVLVDDATARSVLWQQVTAYTATRRTTLKDEARASANTILADATERLSALLGSGDAALATREQAATALVDRVNEETTRAAISLEGRAQASIDELEKTRQRYEEVMRLKAPVDYWSEKGIDHRVNVRTYRLWLTGLSIGFIPIMALVYMAGWWALSSYTTMHPAEAVAMTLYVAGFVGAVTAVGLWFIRIVVRLYMSQHHLAVDADERASLLRTYLALTEAGKVSEEQRALVLSAVFRPVPDGIVKDDGAPVMNPAGLLALLLDKKG